MATKKLSFEDNLEKIKEYIEILENENTSLEESIDIYEKCQKLISDAQKSLDVADGKVKKIIEKLGDIEISDLD